MNMKMNKYHLTVFEDLRDNEFFFKTNNLIRYFIPSLKNPLVPKDIGGKVMAVWDLRKWGAIVIHNQERFLDKLEYEFEILVQQPAFNELYKECVSEVAKIDFDNYRYKLENEKDLPVLKKKLAEYIRLYKVPKLRKSLLVALADFNPIATSLLKTQVKTNNLPGLRIEVNKKFKGSGFFIESHKPKEIGKSGEYQLAFNHMFKSI